MAKSYTVGLVGEANYQDAIRALRHGERVYLTPEPDNAHDPRAIAARDSNGAPIGYIPRDHWVTAALIDQGKGSRAIVHRIEGGDSERPNLGVVLTVELGEKGAPVGKGARPATPSAPSSSMHSDLAPGGKPETAEERARRYGLEPRGNKVGKGCLIAVAVVLALGIVGSLLPDPPPPTAEEKAQQAADEKADAAAAKENVKSWYGEIMAAAKICDGPSKDFADAAEAVVRGGGTLNAYQAAKRAERECRRAWSAFADIEAPAGVSSEIEDEANQALKDCRMAYAGKQTAAASAAEIFDGNMSNSAVTEFQQQVGAAQAGQLACVGRAMSTAAKAGYTTDEIAKF